MIPQIKKEIMQMSILEAREYSDVIFEKYASRSIRAQELEIVTLKATFVKNTSEIKSLMIKFPRIFKNMAALKTLQNEHKNLNSVNKLLHGTELADCAPKPIFLKTINSCPVLATEFMDGTLLSELLFSRDVYNQFLVYSSKTVPWLQRLKKLPCQTGEPIPLTDHLNFLADFHISKFPDFSIPNAIKMERLKELFKMPPSMKAVCQHNDFHADNLFLSKDGRLLLIDWEDFSCNSIPSFDAIHFVATFIDALFLVLKSSGRLSAISQINSDENWKRSFQDYFDLCMDLLDIPQELKSIIIPIYLLQSVYLASDERKQSSKSISKLNFLLSTFPQSIADLAESIELYNLLDTTNETLQKGRIIDKITNRLSSASILKQLQF